MVEDQKSSFEKSFVDDNIHAAIRDGLTSFRDAFHVTCRSSDQPHNQCGQCKACIVDTHIHAAKEWWLQTGDLMKRRFLLALISRLKADILNHLSQILRPFVDAKDYTYTRNKFETSRRPSADNLNMMDDSDPVKRQEEAMKLIVWFNHEDKYSQGSFILAVLQWCESYLIFTIALNILSLQDLDSEDEDHKSDLNNNSRLGIASVLSNPSSLSLIQPSMPILKRPKTTTSASSMRQKSSVSFASSTGNLIDSDTEQPVSAKRHPKYKDYIRQLPIYLAKLILCMLDTKSLDRCKHVSTYWKKLATEVEDEATMTKMLYDDMMLLQSSATLQCNPVFARDTLVPVPDLFRINANEKPSPRKRALTDKNISTWNQIYEVNSIPTRLVLMEERNIYCGPYNVLLLKDDPDRRRVVHMSGENIVAITSRDGRVRLIDMQSAQERPMVLVGHAASVHCIVVQEEKKRVFTGSYDLTVRCWNLETGRCIKLYHGHDRTVTCLAVSMDLIAAGGNDNLCLVWRYKYNRPWRTYKHKHPVSAVAISDETTLSGDIQGKVKVWHNPTGTLIKSVKHRLAITSVKLDKWHVASSSHDYYASVWTSQGALNTPLCTFRHPKEVLCMEFLFLRLLTGCGDGKIRIWSVLSGLCLRVMRGNSVSDPVTSLIATANRVLINTLSSLLLMNFESITYDYTLEEDSAPAAIATSPPLLSMSVIKRKRSSTKQRKKLALKINQNNEKVEEKPKEVKVLFDNENIGLDLTLEETKQLLKRQMRGGADEKRKLLPEEFRIIQQSPFYRADKSKDDTVYSEHRPIPLKLADRPPSSPSRFDLKTRIFRSQSQYHMRSAQEVTPTRPRSPVSMFEIVHRPPSQINSRLNRQTSELSSTFKSPSLKEDNNSQQQQINQPKPPRPQTVPTTYEVKRGGKIYKVVVGYVSPFTSPLQRQELHLKTDGEVDLVIQKIKQQQEQQRLSKPHVWLGLPPTSTLK
ncbi:unnamed protein product [Rotaria socialis]|uniref:F-box/WD repeat-containing protein 10 n=1 Tax=Rotaria socialis TaxID=392032 RepID=A0A820RXY8_9BILA|nr:unnamed protein product [Rotaria socialis]CAF3366555.1 unnamed protein product [Rotaria socialis]CAF3689039.1 unnamed protein product [Rotaria socialis]CAF3694427.1 unnamed protein product [Rotaria socialis]CAF4112831.1 unnamed protein product [Rotaria socialis]